MKPGTGKRSTWLRRGTAAVCLLLLVGTLAACSSAPAPQKAATPPPAAPAPAKAPAAAPAPAAPAKAPEKVPELPKLMTWTSYDVGSSGYAMTAAFGDTLMRETGTRLRVIPGGTDVSRLSPVRTGAAQISATGAGGAISAQEGIAEFAAIEWGPQPVRHMWMAISDAGFTLGVTKDVNVKVPADLKGKRVGYVLGAPALNIPSEAILAFGGLTWKDVKRVDFPSYTAALRGLAEGQSDAMYGLTETPVFEEVATSRRGLSFVTLPKSDKAGWERLQKISPWLSPHSAIRSAGGVITKDKPMEIAILPYPAIVTYANQDDDLVYASMKALHELYPKYKSALPAMAELAIERRIPFSVPYHPAAIKFLKSIGNWKEADEALHQQALKRQDVLQKTFAQAVEKAAEQKVPSNKFPEFWLGMRAKAVAELGS